MHQRVARLAVESTTLASIGHCAETLTLDVEFRTGEVYCYLAVPRAIYEGLVRAASKGTFFHRFVRGQFQFVRIAPAAGGLRP